MKLCRFRADGAEAFRCGVLVDEGIVALPADLSMMDLITLTAGELARVADQATAAGTAPIAVDSVELGPPLASPPSLRDFSAFEQHIVGLKGFAPDIWYQVPMFYFSNPHAIQGPYEDVPIPPGSQRFDFELEVAAVIGAPLRDATPEEAEEAIFGYAILNDWSARDIQKFEMQGSFGFPKGKDGASSLGPWLVTADELEQYRSGGGFDLAMNVTLNGQHFGSDKLSNLHWSFGEMISYASRGAWLKPGDVIGSGTCGGGSLAEYWGRNGPDSIPSLAPGDLVTVSVDVLGEQRTRIVAGAEPIPLRSGY